MAGDQAAYKQSLAGLFSSTSNSHDTAGTRLFAHFGARLVELLGLRRGERVLDVGAGTGATALPAADAVGPTGRVIGIDIAPGMVAQLQANIARRGVTNAEAMVADGDDLPFADESFDAVICAFTLFFFPDAGQALREFARVLRSGGTLAISTFTKHGSDSVDRMWELIAGHIEGPSPGPAVRFDERTQIESALHEASFQDVVIEESPLELVLEDLDEWWSWIHSMEFREYVERMDSDTLERFRLDAARQLGAEPHAPPIRFRMDAFLTRARKPGPGAYHDGLNTANQWPRTTS